MSIVRNHAPVQPAIRFVPIAFDDAYIRANVPMVTRILATYNLTLSSSRQSIALALREFIARNLVHAQVAFHPNGSATNLTVLPTGKTWADFNTAFSTRGQSDADWTSANIGYSGAGLLDYYFGTLNLTDGTRGSNGLLQEVSDGRWQIRDLATYRSAFCSFQHVPLAALTASCGIPGTICITKGHHSQASYLVDDTDGGLAEGWVINDATYNESHWLDGAGLLLGPAQLQALSLEGKQARIVQLKGAGPSYDPAVYFAANGALDKSYFNNPGHPNGMNPIGSLLNIGSIVRTIAPPVPVIQLGMTPGPLSDVNYPSLHVRGQAMFPEMGAYLTRLHQVSSTWIVGLASSWVGPGTHVFQKRTNGGAWADLAEGADTVLAGTGRVEYRPRDSLGFYGGRVTIDV